MSELRYEELVSVLNLLNQTNVPMESIIASLLRGLTVQDFLRLGYTILHFLQDKLVTQIQRLLGYIILFAIHRYGQSHQSTLLQLFLDAVEVTESMSERLFVTNLLSSPSYFDEIKIHSSEYIYSQISTASRNYNELDLPNLRLLKESLLIRIKHSSNDNNNDVKSNEYLICGVLPIIAVGQLDQNASPQPLQWANQDITEDLKLSQTLTASSTGGVLKPEFVIFAPPICEIDEELELQWLDGMDDDLLSLMWDGVAYHKSSALHASSNETVLGENDQMRELMATACESSLNPKQQQQLSSHIRREPSFVQACDITPAKISLLVENNAPVAVDCILSIMKLHDGPVVMEYLSALVNMDISFHSIEVVNGLSAATDLPTEFIHLYISNCISSCENNKDKFMQSRFVRLVCVLLQSLIRKNVVNIRDLFAEVQAFCLTFSKVKEAILLFRLIKSFEVNSH
eukprot:gene14584-19585_t